MTLRKLLSLLFVFLVTVTIHSQTEEEYCEKWNRQMDTIKNLDSRLKLSKQMISKVDDLCRTQIYMHLGQIFSDLRKIDSSDYFYNKAIVLGEAQGEEADEYLGHTYVQKAYNLIDNNKEEEASVFLKKAKVILNRNPDHKAWIMYYNYYAVAAEKKSDYNSSIKYTDSTINFSIRIKDTLGIGTSYHNRGFYNYNLSNFEEATKDLLRSIELNRKQNKINSLAGTYYVLSVCYGSLDQNETAIKYAKKGIEASEKSGSEFIASLNYSTLSESYRKLNQNDNALRATDSSLVLAKRLNYDPQIIQALTDKAGIYYVNLKQYDKAEEYYLEAYKIAKSSNTEVYMNPILGGLIGLYIDNKEYNKAAKYLKLQEVLMKKVNVLTNTAAFHENYSEYYEKIGQPTLALEHLKKYHQIKDSISSQEVKTKVADLEKKYDTKKKELAIVGLNREKQEQQQITKQAKAQQNLYLLVAGFLLFLLGVGAWAFRKLRKQQKELASTNQVKNRLFSIIAHDLRGMIIPFQRSGKILKHHIDKGNHEKTIELSKALEQNSESLSNMLDNLLNWSLEQMNGYKMNLQNISVKEQLTEIISGYNQQAAHKKTKIELEYQNDFNIKFDKGAFHVIFRNLIGNALKYTEEGNIRVKFTSKNDMFLCSVIDTGVGMSQDQLENLFTLEEKKSTIGTQGEKGTGLGLNLVYRFIKMHKGTIQVSSEKRIGTRFDLNIPVKISLTKEEEKTAEPLSA
ncbi:tetratricopeptide repeat-containing sensor histidine kinase [uncultured Aquimarina sp.]|uniref:tetratricopeptide repeat-containing sensor histidine kinase n=1 Tax=uncultured Aquimarina sp. TaxID=575652 RepID=UPI0026359636|nr:tetratricopeptide repeat-containing sensor histidine kinase [uncultured Aquimarina sp.]